jgi:hypothetical protein
MENKPARNNFKLKKNPITHCSQRRRDSSVSVVTYYWLDGWDSIIGKDRFEVFTTVKIHVVFWVVTTTGSEEHKCSTIGHEYEGSMFLPNAGTPLPDCEVS